MYLTKRFYIALTAIILVIGLGYLAPWCFILGKGLLVVFALAVVAEIAMLYWGKRIHTFRTCSDRFSNGDDNDVAIRLESSYAFPVRLEVIDEAPVIFQRRDISYRVGMKAREGKTLHYKLRPTERGTYSFGQIRVFASTLAGFTQRRYTLGAPEEVKVYPSYLMLRKYEFMAISDTLTEQGIKRIRRVGNHTEFEQIKDYVAGDDFRTINWKASARKHQLMVNVYQDEKSQHIYNVIDSGRIMQQTFNGMTLLDYAINASLVLSYIALKKSDKAGILPFCEHADTILPADKRADQMHRILEMLYAHHTDFGESDYSALCVAVRRHISKRSLLIIYTNFDSPNAMQRQLPYLRQLARKHCLLVVFFKDMETADYVKQKPQTVEDYYRQVIAEKYLYEQRKIASTLTKNGIHTLLTAPEALSVNVINKYLELKARNMV